VYGLLFGEHGDVGDGDGQLFVDVKSFDDKRDFIGFESLR
jgi:hypothetical protein